MTILKQRRRPLPGSLVRRAGLSAACRPLPGGSSGADRATLAESLTRAALNATSAVAPSLAGRVSFFLFRNPIRRGKVGEAERDVHQRAVAGELSVNGKTVVTYRWGDGTRPVLLLHGWQSRASRYAGFVPALQALGLSPVSFDAPGHGDSGGQATTILEYRDIIRQLQDRYGPFDAVIAHSFGVAAAFLALRQVLTAGQLVAVAGVSDFRFLLDEFCRRLRLSPRLRQDLRRRIEEELFPDTAGLWELFDAKQRTDEIALPILVIHDQHDATVPIGQAHLLKAAYGDQLTLITTTSLGHRKILTDPAVIHSVLAFLNAPAPPHTPA